MSDQETEESCNVIEEIRSFVEKTGDKFLIKLVTSSQL